MAKGPKPFRATNFANGKHIHDGLFENDPDSVDTGVEDMTDEEFKAELEDIGVGHLLPDDEGKSKS